MGFARAIRLRGPSRAIVDITTPESGDVAGEPRPAPLVGV
jgi:hypothetical protein